MSLADDLHTAVARVAPITGLSIGRRDDRKTWVVSFRHEATDAHKQAAAAVLENFDPLTSIKRELAAEIDAQAEAARMAVLTPGTGQAQEYAQVALEASAVLMVASPALADYPMLAASIGVESPRTGNDAADLKAAAQAVMQRKQACYGALVAIRRKRLEAKAAVKAARTEADARAAAQVAWTG